MSSCAFLVLNALLRFLAGSGDWLKAWCKPLGVNPYVSARGGKGCRVSAVVEVVFHLIRFSGGNTTSKTVRKLSTPPSLSGFTFMVSRNIFILNWPAIRCALKQSTISMHILELIAVTAILRNLLFASLTLASVCRVPFSYAARVNPTSFQAWKPVARPMEAEAVDRPHTLSHDERLEFTCVDFCQYDSRSLTDRLAFTFRVPKRL